MLDQHSSPKSRISTSPELAPNIPTETLGDSPFSSKPKGLGARILAVTAATALFFSACGGASKASKGVENILGVKDPKTETTSGVNEKVQDALDKLKAAIQVSSCGTMEDLSTDLRDEIQATVENLSPDELESQAPGFEGLITEAVGELSKADCHSDTNLTIRATLKEATAYISNKIADQKEQQDNDADDKGGDVEEYDDAQIMEVKDNISKTTGTVFDRLEESSPESLSDFMRIINDFAKEGTGYSEEDLLKALCYDGERNKGKILPYIAEIFSGYYPSMVGVVGDNIFDGDALYDRISRLHSGNEIMVELYIQGLQVAAENIEQSVQEGRLAKLASYGCSDDTIAQLGESLKIIADNFDVISQS